MSAFACCLVLLWWLPWLRNVFGRAGSFQFCSYVREKGIARWPIIVGCMEVILGY